MGFSNSYVERLRKKARGVILPTQEICAILESSFDLSAPRTIADFGAGTQYLLFYTALFVLGFCFIKSSNRRAYSMTFILVGAIGFIATELFHKLGLPAGIPSLSNLQAHKFPPSLPYILASCFSLGLLLFFYQYLSKCNLAQILQQSRIVLARANNRGGGGAKCAASRSISGIARSLCLHNHLQR